MLTQCVSVYRFLFLLWFLPASVGWNRRALLEMRASSARQKCSTHIAHPLLLAIVLLAGTDGCSSEPLAVLKTAVLQPSNTLVGPSMYTLQMLDPSNRVVSGRGAVSCQPCKL
jgi:hypothetical protein